MTLNGIMAVILRYFSEFGSLTLIGALVVKKLPPAHFRHENSVTTRGQPMHFRDFS